MQYNIKKLSWFGSGISTVKGISAFSTQERLTRRGFFLLFSFSLQKDQS